MKKRGRKKGDVRVDYSVLDKKLIRLFKNKKDYGEIAREMNCARSTVGNRAFYLKSIGRISK